MNFDYDMGTGRNELMWKISHDEETDDLISEINKCQDVNYTDKQGVGYIDLASMHHKVRIIEALLKKGANPNSYRHNRAPLLHALGRRNDNNPEILKLFLKYGVNLDIIVNGMTIREAVYSFDFNNNPPLFRPIIEEFESTH